MVGDTKTSALTIDHLGWLVCDGRLLNVSDWRFLFDVIGYSFGSNGSGTQFKLPNPAGRVPGFVGSGAGLTARSMGNSVGEETHTLTVGEMPTHSHGVTDPTHQHTGTTDAAGWGATATSVNTPTTQTEVADNAGNHVHNFTTQNSATGISIQNTGGSNAHNNMQPTLFLGNLFIYSGKYRQGSFPFEAGTNLI